MIKYSYSSNLIACIWDFDKTLIPEYMQKPIFAYYGTDEKRFWSEVRELPAIYAKRGIPVSEDIMYLNHLLTYVKNGPFRGLNNSMLRKFGEELVFFDGLPEFFDTLKNVLKTNNKYAKYDIHLEHYIISNGMAEMIRGSKIAKFVDGIYGCEFLEDPMLPGFEIQSAIEFSDENREISQIARIVDNTIKTRFLFEINKGTNKNESIQVNSFIPKEERRIPIENMIYIADGPTDVPMFTVIRERGGKAFAVHTPDNLKEFAQNDLLLQSGRIDCYGPADYRSNTHTHKWLKMHVEKIADRIIEERETKLKAAMKAAPSHSQDDTSQQKCCSSFAAQANLFD